MKTLLRSRDFSCPSCVSKIETALTDLPGVQAAKVHFNTGRIEVQHDPEIVTEQDLIRSVASMGYRASISAF